MKFFSTTPKEQEKRDSYDSKQKTSRRSAFFKSKSTLKIALTLGKILIFALIAVWIARQLQKGWSEASQYNWRPQYSWLVVSGVFYLLAFLPSAIFWFMSLRWFGQKPTLGRSISAFYYSQPGKYVPGKALVVVIRSACVASTNVRASVAAVCVFYETLTTMGTGAFIAALIVLFQFRAHYLLSIAALATAACSIVPLFPPVLRKVLKFLRVGKNDPAVEESLKRLNFRSLAIGMALTTILWLFFGLSLWASIQSLDLPCSPSLIETPRYVATNALAMSLGFAVPIAPGGLGIREAVLSVLLTPCFSEILARPENLVFAIEPDSLSALVSIIQRIASICAEIGIVAILQGAALLGKITRKTRNVGKPRINDTRTR